ncbi:uncharacterized protein [Spinacia oleracea]|uniref:Uncharacterized protein n=1 Tax=Spinacia oleracea TaxID=3562 RepID=A0ABM3R7F3_SPIOL|nr:uncharacterized protein LOC130467101 [Spinacia oleracea]
MESTLRRQSILPSSSFLPLSSPATTPTVRPANATTFSVPSRHRGHPRPPFLLHAAATSLTTSSHDHLARAAPASPPSLRRRCRAPARRQSLSSSLYSWRRILFRRLLKVLKWPISLFTQVSRDQ